MSAARISETINAKRNKGQQSVRRFFSYDAINNCNVCNIQQCGYLIKTNDFAKLKYHVKFCHTNDYIKMLCVNKRTTARLGKRPRSKVSTNPNRAVKRQCLEQKLRNIGLIAEGQEKILSHNIQTLVDEEMVTLLPTMQDMIISKAAEIRQSIRMEIMGKFVCLKIDAIKKDSRRFLGINIQFVNDGVFKLRTLQIEPIPEKYTTLYLTSVIQKILDQYSIDMDDVYALITDNGWDIVNSSEVLVTIQNQLIGRENSTVSNIPCLKDCLQLSMNGALESMEQVNRILIKARKVAAALQIMSSEYNSLTTGRPLWYTAVELLESHKRYKDVCKMFTYTENNIALTDEEWVCINNILQSLAPAKIAYKKLHSEQLTPGTQYAIWMKCKDFTSKISTNLAAEIVRIMVKEEKKFIENGALLASIYLDPCFPSLILKGNDELVVRKLTDVWQRLNRVCNNVKRPIHHQMRRKDNAGYSDFIFEEQLEKAFAMRKAETYQKLNIREIVEEFQIHKSFESIDDVLLYWESNKNEMPELYRLAEVVHAACSISDSHERLKSQTSFMTLALNQDNWDANILNDIMLIKCNDNCKH